MLFSQFIQFFLIQHTGVPQFVQFLLCLISKEMRKSQFQLIQFTFRTNILYSIKQLIWAASEYEILIP